MTTELEVAKQGEQISAMREDIANLTQKIESIHSEMIDMKLSMHKGWGILVGVAAIVGLFVTDIVNAVKRMLGS